MHQICVCVCCRRVIVKNDDDEMRQERMQRIHSKLVTIHTQTVFFSMQKHTHPTSLFGFLPTFAFVLLLPDFCCKLSLYMRLRHTHTHYTHNHKDGQTHRDGHFVFDR